MPREKSHNDINPKGVDLSAYEEPEKLSAEEMEAHRRYPEEFRINQIKYDAFVEGARWERYRPRLERVKPDLSR